MRRTPNVSERELAEGELTWGNPTGLNGGREEHKESEHPQTRRAHQNKTGRFLENELLVQLWVTLKVRNPSPPADIEVWGSSRRSGRRRGPSRAARARWAPWSCDEWWDDAFMRWIREIQRLVGSTVGYVRADEARPYRHIHVAIVAHHPVPLAVAQQAWLTVTGFRSPDAAWAEAYEQGGGGLSYQMKADGGYRSNWRLSPNIDLFRRTGDGMVHRPSTSRERRNARRILQQRNAVTRSAETALTRVAERVAEGPAESGATCSEMAVAAKERPAVAIRLVDPRCGGRLVASCPPGRRAA